MSDIGFALNYTHLYLIDITPTAVNPTWARLGQGITKVEPDDSDETSEEYYYDGEGVSTEDVTGGSRGYKIEGDRYYGNAAQDFIAGLRFKSGEERSTNFKHIGPDGRAIEGRVTVKDIVDSGGDANNKGGFECALKFRGKPTITEPTAASVPATVSASNINNLAVGSTSAITPTVTPSGASTAMAYASSDPTVATVDDYGVVTAVRAGTCSISMKSIVCPSVVGTVSVKVVNAS